MRTMTEPPPSEPFLALAATTDDLVFVWKVTGEMLWVNRAFERETGMTVEDFGFQNTDNPFVHPEDLPGVLEAMGVFIDSDAKISPPIDNRFFDMWGRARKIRSIVHKVEWRGESALMLVSRLLDDPDEDGTEATYRRLVEAADDGIVQLDPEGRIVTSNRRMHDLTGLRHVEIVRRRLADLFAASGRELAEAALAKLRAGEASASFRACLEATGLWMDVNLTRIDAGDPSLVALAIARDVTETRRLEAEVLRREKEESLGLLVGGIAHDLNNILTGVIANASDAAARVESGSPLAQVLADLQLAGERAADLGRSMLEYLGQAPTIVAEFALDEIVHDTVRVVGPLLGSAVSVEVEADQSDVAVRCDASQVGQVIMNLITNAAQAFGTRGGNIRITTGVATLPDDGGEIRPRPLDGSFARVLVADDGPGMAPQVLARIFDPYFSTKARGRGLGLATILGVLRRHGGGVRVTSELGRGTTFEVFLPIAEAKASTSPAPTPVVASPVAAPRTAATILFVDDEEAILRMAKRVLDRAGHRTLIASRGDEALALLRTETVDAVVLDSFLPDADGSEVAESMRELVPDLPILRSSGYQAEDLVPPGEPFLPKPYRVAELLAAVESLLATTSPH